MRGHEYCTWHVTDKNIKLHIVTDIKVTINSLSAFGFRYLGGGAGLFINNENGISDSFTRSLTLVFVQSTDGPNYGDGNYGRYFAIPRNIVPPQGT